MHVLKQIRNTAGLLAKGRAPGQLIIQYTDFCNASCPQCGMRVSHKFHRTRLTTEKVKTIIRAAAEQGVAALSFTGGEPFLFLDDICELAGCAGDHGIPYIRTGTNGFLFRGSEKPDFADRIARLADKLATSPLRNIWVSIDSVDPATHEQMRGLPGVVKGIEKAVPIFASRGLYLSANLGINRNLAGAAGDLAYFDEEFFLRGFDQFYRFVANLGFTIANVCYPMHSDDRQESAVYAATASDRVVSFSIAEKLALFRALLEVIPNHRQKLRIFTPRCSLHALIRQYSGEEDLVSGCRGGREFFFVDSNSGHVFPCGYRGDEDMGELADIDVNQHSKKGAECRRCDWECFRDPSELFSPMLDLRNHPLRLLKRLYRDMEFFRLWKEDLLYYRSCNYFSGRIAG